MRFLHTGDLHLDSAFCSSDTFGAEEKRAGQRRMLRRIFDLAREQRCEMMLISGDLFDSRYVTPETERCVRTLIEQAGIPVVVSPGNHDPYVAGSFYARSDLPENLYVFNSSQLQRFDFPELRVSVYGYAFTSASLTVSPLVGESRDESAGIKLLCAHADISSPLSRYCPLTVGDVSRLGISYAALGHIHNRDIDDSAEGAVIRYCGFPEGRSFDELGEGGVFVVDCNEDGDVSLNRLSVSAHKFEAIELDISDCAESGQMIEKISKAAKDMSGSKDTFLRLTLTGTAESDQLPDLEALEKKLVGEGLVSIEIRDMTLPAANIDSLRADKTIKGEFYRALYSGLVSEDAATREKTALALRIGLAAIEGRRIGGGNQGV